MVGLRAAPDRHVSSTGPGQNRDMGRYAFDRSWGLEDDRLAAVERQLDPVSRAAVDHLGLAAGWQCWEVGAGRGSIARWLAGRVTARGSVLASDTDVRALAGLAHGNTTVVRHDLERDDVPEVGFDLIHARLVLEHLRAPLAAVRKLASALGKGGWLVLEDADGLLFEAEPEVSALAEIAGPWHRAALQAGWNPLYGRQLAASLQRAGLGRVAGWAHRSYQPGGRAWAGARLGLERMQEQIRQAGASRGDLDDALAALDDPARIIMGGPIITAWGQHTS
jgi:SAM-dependent methyltransferase